MLYMLSTNLEVYSAQKYLSIVRSRQGHLMVAFGIGPISEEMAALGGQTWSNQ